MDQKRVQNAMRIIRSTVNEYPERFIVGEIGSDTIDVLKQYQSDELLDVVFNFNFGSIPFFSVERIFNELNSMEKNMSDYPTLFFGSHDMPRMIDRLAGGSAKRAEALAVLLLTAKGVPFIYYGEEIGMHNITAHTPDEIKDIQAKTHYRLALNDGKTPDEALMIANENNRDRSRSPMQWNSDLYAGFSTKKSWIKINQDNKDINVADFKKNKSSILNTYRKIITLRNTEEILQCGSYKSLERKGDMILFTRELDGESITVIINFGNEIKMKMPKKSKVLSGSVVLRRNEYCIYKI